MQIGEEGSRRVPNGCRKILARDQDRTREGEELLFKWEWMAEIRIRIDDFWTRACASSGSSKGRENIQISWSGFWERQEVALLWPVIYFHDAPIIPGL